MSAAIAVLETFSLIWKIILYGSPFYLLILLFIWKIRWGKFPLEAIIIEKRGDNLVKTNDRVGKHVDKYTGLTSYRFQKCKDKIPVYNFDWVMHNAVVNTNLLEKLVNIIRKNMGCIFLFRYGSKQYKPITGKPGKDKLKLTKVKDPEGKEIIVYQYQQFDPRGVIGALDFEVVDWDNINFMIQEHRATDERRRNRSDFLKSLAIPAMIIAGAVVIGIFILKFSMDTGRELRSGVGQPANAGGGTTGKIGGTIGNVITPGA